MNLFLNTLARNELPPSFDRVMVYLLQPLVLALVASKDDDDDDDDYLCLSKVR
jgi:hypothetical protein